MSASDDEAHIAALAARYRERYAELGFQENTPYPGVRETLAALKRRGSRLGVRTSKLRHNAIKTLEMFNLIPFLDFISGPTATETKSQQLRELLHDKTIDPEALMIGDRPIGLQAAHDNQLQSAGVIWGYGDRRELESEQPAFLFASFPELFQALTPQR